MPPTSATSRLKAALGLLAIWAIVTYPFLDLALVQDSMAKLDTLSKGARVAALGNGQVKATTSLGTIVTLLTAALSLIVLPELIGFVRRSKTSLLAIAFIGWIFILALSSSIYRAQADSENIARALRLFNCFFVGAVFAEIVWSRGDNWTYSTLLALLATTAGASAYLFIFNQQKLLAYEFGDRLSISTAATSTAEVFIAGVFLTHFPFVRRKGALAGLSKGNLILMPLKWAVVGMAALFVIFSGSRGPLVSYAVFCLMLIVLSRNTRSGYMIGLSLLLTTLTLFFFLDPVEVIARSSHVFDKLSFFFTNRNTGFTSGRTLIWSTVISQTAESLQTFLFGVYQPLPAHNMFLGIISNYGLIGLILFVLLQMAIFANAYWLLSRCRGTRFEALCAVTLSLQVAVFCYGQIENSFFLNQGPVMALYYLLAGAQALARARLARHAMTARIDYTAATIQ